MTIKGEGKRKKNERERKRKSGPFLTKAEKENDIYRGQFRPYIIRTFLTKPSLTFSSLIQKKKLYF